MKGCGRRSTREAETVDQAGGDADQRPDQDDDRATASRPASAIASDIIASASTEPTERSMPAVRMTRNMPIDSSAFMAICLRMLVRFCDGQEIFRLQRVEEHHHHA